MTVSRGASYDDVLVLIGGMGRYQKRLLFLAGVACAAKSVHLLMTIFTMGAQDFRCAIPSLDNDTYHIQSEAHRGMLNSSIPFDDEIGAYSQCYRYKDTESELDVNPTSSGNSSSHDLQKCTKWVYSTDVFATSIVSQMDLVCDRKIYTNHANMMTMTGLLVGSILGGTISDRFGRKKAFLSMIWLFVLTVIALGFVKSVYLFLVLRLVLTTATVGFFASACVLCMEVVDPKRRALAGMIPMFGWSVGMFVLVFLAFFIRSWQTLQLVAALPLVVMAIIFIWLFPESPRWLISKGRYSEADAMLKTMAKANNREIPEKMLMSDAGAAESLTTDSDDNTEEEEDKAQEQTSSWRSALRLAQSPILLIRLLVLSFGWFANNLVYYGLTLNVGSIIEGDIYLNFFIMSILEIISYGLVLLSLMGPVGRKPVFCTCVLLGGVACLSTIFPIVLDIESKWFNMIFSNLGKFFITAAFGLVWIYTPELLPTQVRQTGLGVCSMMGRIGGIISPYIAALDSVITGDLGKVLPLLVFGSCSILAGVMSLFLPETSNRKLPETIEDAETMSWRNKKRTPNEDIKARPC